MACYDRRAEWSVCAQPADWSAASTARTAGATRGLCGYASRSLKDAVLEYLRSMKTLETLLMFVTSRSDAYYERRLTDTVLAELQSASALRFMQDCEVKAQVLTTVTPLHYQVLMMCSCRDLNCSCQYLSYDTFWRFGVA